MTYVYPRLDTAVALGLLAEYSPLTTPQLAARAGVDHPGSEWYPTARSRVSEEHLRGLQSLIRETAAGFGYPRLNVQRSPEYTRFDQQLALELFRRMEIVPADAAHEGVWSFLSLVLAPDVALWRFPNRQQREDYERILGRPRNVFRRLWWRSYAFGADEVHPGALLLEDEAVGIMERPTLGGDPRIASALARTHLRVVGRYPALPRTEVMRDAAKRVRRLASVLTLSALPDPQLESLLAEVFAVTVAAFGA